MGYFSNNVTALWLYINWGLAWHVFSLLMLYLDTGTKTDQPYLRLFYINQIHVTWCDAIYNSTVTDSAFSEEPEEFRLMKVHDSGFGLIFNEEMGIIRNKGKLTPNIHTLSY